MAFSTITALNLWFTAWVLTNELALGCRAFRLGALPVAHRLITKNFALGDRCLAVSHALGLLADGHALWAVHS